MSPARLFGRLPPSFLLSPFPPRLPPARQCSVYAGSFAFASARHEKASHGFTLYLSVSGGGVGAGSCLAEGGGRCSGLVRPSSACRQSKPPLSGFGAKVHDFFMMTRVTVPRVPVIEVPCIFCNFVDWSLSSLTQLKLEIFLDMLIIGSTWVRLDDERHDISYARRPIDVSTSVMYMGKEGKVEWFEPPCCEMVLRTGTEHKTEGR